MKHPKITEEHIQELYSFTRQHFVEHYDLQTELVDHMANDIEQIWEDTPSLSFYEAKTNAFKKFGVFGFMEVVEARQKALSKKYWKLLWKFSKDWFQPPKIAITGSIFVLSYLLLQTQFAENFFIGFLLLLCIIGMYKAIKLKREFNKNFNLTGKKWMLEEMIYHTGFGSVFMIPVNIINIVNLTDILASNTSIFSITITALLFTFFTLIFYIALYVLPQKAEELLLENYPEYKLSM